jgi:hypothetical protein
MPLLEEEEVVEEREAAPHRCPNAVIVASHELHVVTSQIGHCSSPPSLIFVGSEPEGHRGAALLHRSHVREATAGRPACSSLLYSLGQCRGTQAEEDAAVVAPPPLLASVRCCPSSSTSSSMQRG